MTEATGEDFASAAEAEDVDARLRIQRDDAEGAERERVRIFDPGEDQRDKDKERWKSLVEAIFVHPQAGVIAECLVCRSLLRYAMGREHIHWHERMLRA